MGTPKYIETPERLWELFTEYENQLPIIEVPVSHVKLGVAYLPIKAPMTMEGFKDYCYDRAGVIKHYIDNTDGRYSDYSTIVTRIKERIFNNNMSKAAVGMYKENLIAKQLGMAEKTENKNDNTHRGKVQIEVIKSDIPLANNEKDINV